MTQSNLPRFNLHGDIETGTDTKLAAFLGENPGPVVLVINSGGGNAAVGAAMLAEVERHGRVTARIQGLAASAASLVAVGCYDVLIHPDAMFMIHEPAVETGGTADDLRDVAAVLDKMNLTYAKAYARHTGHPVETILEWMKVETWLTAEEAVELRFADQVETPEEPGTIKALADFTRFKAVPPIFARQGAPEKRSDGRSV